MWSAITVLAQYLVPGATTPDTFSDLLRIGFKSIGIYWYLYVLFFLYLLGVLFAVKKVDLRYLLCVSVAICLSSPLYRGLTSWTIVSVPLYLVFFVLGMFLCKKEMIIRGAELAVVGICGMLVIAYGLILALNGTMLTNLSIPIISATGAFCISLWLIVMAKKYWDHEGVFTILGQHSLEIFLMHSLLIAGARVALPKIGITNMLLHILISCLLSIGIPILASLVLKKIRLYDFVFRPYGKWREIINKRKCVT